MRRALPRFLRFGFFLPLLFPAIAKAQYADLTENHPGFWVEWLAPASSTIHGVALAYADQDGDPDLFVLDGPSLELWRNDGRGEITTYLGSWAELCVHGLRPRRQHLGVLLLDVMVLPMLPGAVSQKERNQRLR